jgi:hypothetical protein
MLPTHTKAGKSPAAGAGAAVKLQGAFDAGMQLAGLKATKSGSGDKERAYVVRQNWLLKTFLALLVLFGLGVVVVFSTVLKVSVTRREAIKAESMHHQLEHQAQVKLIRAHMELQKALENEVHETSRLEEFRSAADRAVGDHATQVKELLKTKGVDAKILKEIEQADEKLRELLNSKMHAVLQHFHGVAVSARNSLRRVAHAIVSDVELDKRENDRFHEKMSSLGVKVDDAKDRATINKRPENDEYGLFPEGGDARKPVPGQPAQEQDEAPEDAEKEVAAQLERFFAKLEKHKFPLLSADVLGEWEKDMTELQRTLDDESKEIDLEQITKRVNAKMALQAPGVPAFDPAKHSSVIDYYEMRIEEGKLAVHRQSLMDLYNGWKQDGKLSPYTVLSGLEHLAEQNSMYLLYEWLEGKEGDEETQEGQM